MNILNNKVDTSITGGCFLIGAGLLLVSFIASVTVSGTLGGKLADASYTEISYFIKGDNKNLEEQKIINNKNEEYKENINIAYSGNKNITVSYDTTKLNNSMFRFAGRTLYRIYDPTITPLIKRITLDGNEIPVGYFSYDKVIQDKTSENISHIEEKPGKHVINIELK